MALAAVKLPMPWADSQHLLPLLPSYLAQRFEAEGTLQNNYVNMLLLLLRLRQVRRLYCASSDPWTHVPCCGCSGPAS